MADLEPDGAVSPIPPADEETPLLRDDLLSATEAIGASEVVIILDDLSATRLIFVLGSVYVGVFLGALDSTIIATLSAPISTTFNSLSLLSWLASAYLIANAACQPLSGRLTDIFSRKSGLIVANVLFAIGNLMCGLARDEWTMIAGRAVAGMGGGCLMSISTFVASDLVPLRRRGLQQGVGNLVYGSGAGLGGLFGGWANDNWGWRVAFLAQVPFVVVSGVVVYLLVNVPPKQSSKSKLARVDFSGAFTLLAFLVSLLLGLNSGGNLVPWNHPLIYISLPLSGVALMAFIYIELRVASEPILPIRLLLDRTVAAACLSNWCTTAVVYMVMFYTPIYFQIRGMSTTEAGIRLIPQSVGGSIGSLLAGLIMNRTGRYKAMGIIVLGIFTVGAMGLATLDLDSPTWPALIYLFLIGSSYSATLTVTLLAVIAAVDHEHQAVVTSATFGFRSIGSTIGVTIGSTVFQNLLKIKLWDKFGGQKGAAEEIKKIRDNFDELTRLPPGWKEGVLESYMSALQGVFFAVVAAAVLGLLFGSFMKQHKLHTTLARR